MLRRDFLRLATAAPAAAFAQNRRRPNILLIVADDLGYRELGVQGCPDVPTPHTDSIARNGVRFTNGYVSCPVCSPTRAGLMTGRYQQRFGHEFNPGPAQASDPNFGLPLSETTLATRLKELGYVTGAFGKWHLGYESQFHPLKRGFDEYFGFLGGAHSYLNARADTNNPILRGTTPVEELKLTTDAFAAEAASFIRRNAQRPFFAYVPFNAVHGPMEAAPEYLERFARIADPKRRTFAGMLAAMDDGIGRILAALRESKLERDTVIFFVSDNGGPTAVNTASNAPLRGFKGQVLEGGIRVPFFIQWAGVLPSGRQYDQPVIALDMFTTALAAAGGKTGSGARLDGVDLVPFATGKARGAPHENLYWRFGVQRAIRSGEWKLLDLGDGQFELYNVAND
ncbi:MAG TPA: sulfatase-like hydrolase/transferase, partial [Bryobacteraceae bacterium]|nr:sulfatase-like hydrolase/transferase [Bryobacteraceae bacterium]